MKHSHALVGHLQAYLAGIVAFVFAFFDWPVLAHVRGVARAAIR